MNVNDGNISITDRLSILGSKGKHHRSAHILNAWNIYQHQNPKNHPVM